MHILEQYAWPGNVRELRNVIERATILAAGPFIEPKHLPPAVAEQAPSAPKPQVALAPGTTVEEAERRLILMTLEHTRDNKTRAALLSKAIYHRAREVVAIGPDPYDALREDPGLRAILESSLYSKNVTFAAIVDTHDVAVAHADRSLEGQRLPGAGDLIDLQD